MNSIFQWLFSDALYPTWALLVLIVAACAVLFFCFLALWIAIEDRIWSREDDPISASSAKADTKLSRYTMEKLPNGRFVPVRK